MSIPTRLNPFGILYNDNSFYKRELNYLESSTGSQWIDTGISFPRYANGTFAEVDCSIDCKVFWKPTELYKMNNCIFGGYLYNSDYYTNSVVAKLRENTSNTNYFGIYCERDPDEIGTSRMNYEYSLSGENPLNVHIDSCHSYDGPGSEYSIYSNYFSDYNHEFSRSLSNIESQPFLLFGIYEEGSNIGSNDVPNKYFQNVWPCFPGTRIYSFKLTKKVYGSATGYGPPPGLQEEIDLIPVLDKNNIPCMFDKVSQKLFYNQGTGQFLYG